MHGAFVPGDGGVEVAGFGIGHPVGLGHRAHAAPQRGETRLQQADLLQLHLALRLRLVGVLRARPSARAPPLPPAPAPGPAPRRWWRIRRRPRAVRSARRRRCRGRSSPGRRSTGRRPRSCRRGCRPRRLRAPAATASMKVAPASSCAVEGGGEGLGRAVVHRPAGGDDAAHADLDQLVGHAGGEGAAVAAAAPASVPASRPARWQQLTNTSSGTVRMVSISCGPRKVSPESTTPPVRAGLAVAGHVHDAVAPRQQRVDNARRRRRCRSSAVTRSAGSPPGAVSRATTACASASAPGSGPYLAGVARRARRSPARRRRRWRRAARRGTCVLRSLRSSWLRMRPGPRVGAAAAVVGCLEQFPRDGARCCRPAPAACAACRPGRAPPPPAPAAGTACGRSAGRRCSSVEARVTRSRSSLPWVSCARISVRARRVSSVKCDAAGLLRRRWR